MPAKLGLGLLMVLFSMGLSQALFAVGSGSMGSQDVAEPTTAAGWYDQGVKAVDAKNFSQAVADFTQALKLKENFPEAYNMLGFSYRKLGQLANAFKNYEKALKLKPLFPEAREYYGEAFLEADDLLHSLQQYVILKNLGVEEADELWGKIESYVIRKTKS